MENNIPGRFGTDCFADEFSPTLDTIDPGGILLTVFVLIGVDVNGSFFLLDTSFILDALLRKSNSCSSDFDFKLDALEDLWCGLLLFV